MKLTLNINYRTNWGETLYVTGSPAVLGKNNYKKAVALTSVAGDNWVADINIPASTKSFSYRYFVRHDDGTVRDEYGASRQVQVNKNTTHAVMYDRWQEEPSDKPYYSSAITECINRRTAPVTLKADGDDNVIFSVEAPMIAPDQRLVLVGSSEGLGAWKPSDGIPMCDGDFPVWKVSVPRRHVPIGTEYKFVITDLLTGEVVRWETCVNRVVDFNAPQGAMTCVNNLIFCNPLPPYRGAGTAIPVFSVRTDEDFGVGDFISLKKMVDWVAATGQEFLQLLPVNDTTMTGTWTDSYPYNANSTFALHPMYLRLEGLGQPVGERKIYFEHLRKELNALKEVDYERVNNAKNEYVDDMFVKYGKKVLGSDDFKDFFERNMSWLRPYAAFCVLRDKFNTPDFSFWGEYAQYATDKIDKLAANPDDKAAIQKVYYVQYYLDKQLREVRDYAHSKGVALKGDIPIGISRTSADAWVDTRLFNMDCQAGAPPDDFSVMGQNWGFPTYNWEEMSHDGFAWWKARFRKMAEYFDAYRIDHVLGFFRIWQIPMDALHGLLGVFNPALPLTPDEIRDRFGFYFNHDLYTTPYIMDYFLGDFFGDYVDEARERFLEPLEYGRYRLREEFSTQRKIADYFAKETKDDKNSRLCNALLGLIDDVLFIEDPYQKGKYHPRISAQFTYIYRSLNDGERKCFNELYNDFYYHRHNEFWYEKAMWKLPPLIDATHMLVCAEDLGMIPACVPAVMERLQILALEIQRMPKDPGAEFGDTWRYPYYSVCTTSTHDMGGIRSWWEEDREKAQRFFNNVLGEQGAAPQYAEPWICAKILEYHFRSPSMLCIIPLADLLSMDGRLRRDKPQEETINVPANPRHYWRYRMHTTVEKLMAADDFNNQLHTMLCEAGRTR
ncbi:MAG: 4-alpha-glucanotransferase [Muribaculaceae bacterium]|nr:4-alpha-glucanotransferase [Muribaculaceae bacterium]